MKKDYSRGYTPYTKPTDDKKKREELMRHTTDSIMKADYPLAVEQMKNLKLVDGKITGDSDRIIPAVKKSTKKAQEILNKKKK